MVQRCHRYLPGSLLESPRLLSSNASLFPMRRLEQRPSKRRSRGSRCQRTFHSSAYTSSGSMLIPHATPDRVQTQEEKYSSGRCPQRPAGEQRASILLSEQEKGTATSHAWNLEARGSREQSPTESTASFDRPLYKAISSSPRNTCKVLYTCVSVCV